MKKQNIFTIIFSVLLVISCIVYKLSNYNIPQNGDKKVKKTEKKYLEYGNIYFLSDFINKKGSKFVDKRINYDKLGEIKINYELNDKKENLVLEVRDTTSPVILVNDNVYFEKGKVTDLNEKLFCADNYDRHPNCVIEGEYDLGTIGEYNLKLVATDSSNNKNEKEFILHIIEHSQSSSNTKTMFDDVVASKKTDKTRIGIDVSKWQGEIDWKKVKSAGVEFAMIRMGVQNGYNGDLFLDRYFVNNIINAKANDIPVGVYFYSYATTMDEAEKQANWVVEQLKEYKLDLPVVFDWESWSSFYKMDLNLLEITNIQEKFLNIIEEAGYDTSRYGSKNYLTSAWQESIHKTWLAHYIENTTYEGEYYMWQICNNGIVDGIKGYVDIDILFDY